MKKIILSLALAAGFVCANAQQSLVNPEITDNVYVGVNLGANTNLAGNKFFPVNPTLGIRVGKDISPIFGVNVEATAWFGSHTENKRHYIPGFDRFDTYPVLRTVEVPVYDNEGNQYASYETQEVGKSNAHNLFRATNLGINGTVNLSNLIFGYLGEPRDLEVSSIIGMGWGHVFSPSNKGQLIRKEDRDVLTAKTGLDVTYNFGDEKEHQLYVEPAILWNLNKDGHHGVEMNKHYAYLQLAVGYNYKFGCSYGGHNFKYAFGDNDEIARLNNIIRDLQDRLANQKPVTQYVEVPGRTISIDNLKVVPFEVNKWDISEAAMSDLNSIKAGSHVQVIGTASPEGNSEWNQELSNNRANAVAEYLENRGVIVDSKEGRGVEGQTSNRLAIVYVVR